MCCSSIDDAHGRFMLCCAWRYSKSYLNLAALMEGIKLSMSMLSMSMQAMPHSQALLVRHSRPKRLQRPSHKQRHQLRHRQLPAPFRNLLQARCLAHQPPHNSRSWRPHLPGDPSAACQPATFWRAATPWSVRTAGKTPALQQVLDRPPSQPAMVRARTLCHRPPTHCSRRQAPRPGDNTLLALAHGSMVIDQGQDPVSLLQMPTAEVTCS